MQQKIQVRQGHAPLKSERLRGRIVGQASRDVRVGDVEWINENMEECVCQSRWHAGQAGEGPIAAAKEVALNPDARIICGRVIDRNGIEWFAGGIVFAIVD